ncbi:hypothetical protein [Gracilimonas mengyeensis]|uniref:Uncharacterized protein n=1 Tax=Gracilimonas mengyeensis TaxID=1302730 RepID=A0A521AB46_9BACT|nr:hypothetical protein [Gracilimonas mengyeensis]SMO31971.1 hypothetical protein SAMN06265219_10113 [Gracilimonas mengyeensis]
MTNQALSITPETNNSTQLFAVPILKRIEQEGREEYSEMQQAFDLLGWGSLPDELKIEISDDVKFMVEELKGRFSSCDPHVERRRESVHYWVSCYQDGICSLQTAVKALKVKSL